MKRKIIFTVIALVLVGVLVGAYLYFNPNPDVTQDKPDVAVHAKELVAAFDKDTAAARKQFVDKVVEVTGRVKKIDTTGAVIMGEDGSPSEVVIGLDRRHLTDVSKLQVGADAVVQGICSGYSKSGSSDPTDLLANLGTTVQLRSGGVKSKQ